MTPSLSSGTVRDALHRRALLWGLTHDESQTLFAMDSSTVACLLDPSVPFLLTGAWKELALDVLRLGVLLDRMGLDPTHQAQWVRAPNRGFLGHTPLQALRALSKTDRRVLLNNLESVRS